MSDARHSRWHVLGAGSIGCLYAAYMQRAGIDTTLILRDVATRQQLAQAGGVHLEVDGHTSIVPIAGAALTELPGPGVIAHLLICTKAQQTRAAIEAVRPHLANTPTLVLLQNGMGVREELLELLPKATVIQALSTEGAWRRERFVVVHAGRGETLLGGADQAAAQRVAADLSTCGLTLRAVDDIDVRLWHKLAVNCVINPLTALHGCRNGDLLDLPGIADLSKKVCAEIATVGHALGIALNAENLQQTVQAVMRVTQANRSSMLQDIDHGRRTEIDYLNGYVTRQAQQLGLRADCNAELLLAIKTKESHLGCI